MAVQWRVTRVVAVVVFFACFFLVFNPRGSGKPNISLKKPPGKPFEKDPLLSFEGPPKGKYPSSLFKKATLTQLSGFHANAMETGKLYKPGEASRVNATILSLVRNNELEGMLQAMGDLERTWNKKFNYPWTFINDEPFSKEFIRRTKAMTKAEVSYETIPKDHWDIPSWINQDLMKASADYLTEQKVQYSGLDSYHQMCRWNSGMFYRHPALQKYRYYWRVEPKVQYVVISS